MSRLADPMLAERRRRQILDAAMHCFRRRGFHQATMQEICSEAEISPGALYRYFGSKSEIIAAIAGDECDNRFPNFDSVAQGSIIDMICEGVRRYSENLASQEDGALMADILAESARDPLLARTFRRLDQQRIDGFTQWLRAAQAAGEVDPALDAALAARTLLAALEGICLRLVLDGSVHLDDALAQIRSLAERYLRRAAA